MNDFYTYAYLRENGTPYYVGKGRGRRIHREQGRRVKLPPKERRIFLKQNLTEEEAFKHEIYMIAVFGRKNMGTGILLNFTDGGEGGSGHVCSEETREKLRQATLGVKRSPEAVLKSVNARRGKRKRPMSKEGRKRIGEAQKKKVEVTFPSGLVGVFPSKADAAFYSGIPIRTFCRLIKGEVSRKWGDFKVKFV